MNLLSHQEWIMEIIHNGIVTLSEGQMVSILQPWVINLLGKNSTFARLWCANLHLKTKLKWKQLPQYSNRNLLLFKLCMVEILYSSKVCGNTIWFGLVLKRAVRSFAWEQNGIQFPVRFVQKYSGWVSINNDLTRISSLGWVSRLFVHLAIRTSKTRK